LVAGLVFFGILAYGATRTSANPKDVGVLLGRPYCQSSFVFFNLFSYFFSFMLHTT